VWRIPASSSNITAGAVQLLAWQLILGSTKSEVFNLDSVARSQQILTNAVTPKPDCWTLDLLGPQPVIKRDALLSIGPRGSQTEAPAT
jgi:hypothetical protein